MATLAPLEILQIYGYRFRIEVGFRQAVHVLGAYGYHFWMQGTMNPSLPPSELVVANALRTGIPEYFSAPGMDPSLTKFWQDYRTPDPDSDTGTSAA